MLSSNKETPEEKAEKEAKFGKALPQEMQFDKAAYGGISYAAQALTGILLTHSIKFGKLHKPFINAVEKIMRKPQHGEISTTAMIITMVMCGNAFLFPLKWVENRRPKIIRWMVDKTNTKAEAQGNPISEDEKLEQEKRLHYLEHKPPQNWWSLGVGRAFSLVVVFSADYLIGKSRNTLMQKKSAEYIQKGFGAVGVKKMANSKVVGEYLEVGFVDSFYSAVSAGGLYVYSHFICPPKKNASDSIPPFDPIMENISVAPELSQIPKHTGALPRIDQAEPHLAGPKLKADFTGNALPKGKIIQKEKLSARIPEAKYTQKLALEPEPALGVAT